MVVEEKNVRVKIKQQYDHLCDLCSSFDHGQPPRVCLSLIFRLVSRTASTSFGQPQKARAEIERAEKVHEAFSAVMRGPQRDSLDGRGVTRGSSCPRLKDGQQGQVAFFLFSPHIQRFQDKDSDQRGVGKPARHKSVSGQ